jgi:hypothetical protein
MQRLFSMFPRGRAGVALLLLRLALGVAIVYGTEMASPWVFGMSLVCALAFGVGLLTPWAAAAYVAVAIVAWGWTGEAVVVTQGCTMIHATVLGLLGPGGYSLDAKLFGRQQIIVPTRDRLDDR